MQDEKSMKNVISEQKAAANKDVEVLSLHLEFQETQTPVKKEEQTQEEFDQFIANWRAKVLHPLKENIRIKKEYIAFLEGKE